MTRPRNYLSEAEAWRWIARYLDKHTPRFVGLCGLLGECEDRDLIPMGTRHTMRGRIKAHMRAARQNPEDYWIPVFGSVNFEYDYSQQDRIDLRVLAALFLALEAADDAQGA